MVHEFALKCPRVVLDAMIVKAEEEAEAVAAAVAAVEVEAAAAAAGVAIVTGMSYLS